MVDIDQDLSKQDKRNYKKIIFLFIFSKYYEREPIRTIHVMAIKINNNSYSIYRTRCNFDLTKNKMFSDNVQCVVCNLRSLVSIVLYMRKYIYTCDQH